MRTEEGKTWDIITELLARQLPLNTLRDAYSALRYWGYFKWPLDIFSAKGTEKTRRP